MSRFFDANTERISGTITALDTGDWTFGCWVNVSNSGVGNTQAGQLLRVIDGSSNNIHTVRFGGANDLHVVGIQGHATTNSEGSSTDPVSRNTWTCVVTTWRASDGNHRFYFGDRTTAMAQNTTTSDVNPSGARRTGGTNCWIGNNQAAERWLDGSIARPFLVGRELALGEMEAFRQGNWFALFGDPTVKPSFYLPLDSPTASVAEDLSGNGVTFTVTGATVSDEPPITGPNAYFGVRA
jgi:hypothetical protein